MLRSLFSNGRNLKILSLHFKFNGEIYIQCEGAGGGSPLEPLLANIFMISLEDSMLPKLRSCVCNKHNNIITRKLNSYHSNTMFTYELE